VEGTWERVMHWHSRSMRSAGAGSRLRSPEALLSGEVTVRATWSFTERAPCSSQWWREVVALRSRCMGENRNTWHHKFKWKDRRYQFLVKRKTSVLIKLYCVILLRNMRADWMKTGRYETKV
jgi:hypothetical protein